MSTRAMRRTTAYADLDLTDEQRDILDTVRDFVEKDVIPTASELDHADEYPEALVERM